MAMGEKSFSTEGRKAVKYESKPIPSQAWELKLHTSEAEVGKSKQSNLPYLMIPIEALESASKEGGKNRRFYHYLNLGLFDYADGTKPIDGAHQLVGLSKALGTKYQGPVRSTKANLKSKDEDGEEVVEVKSVEFLDANALKKWLQQFDGTVVRGHSRIQPAKDGFPAKGAIDEFFASEEGEASADDDEDEIDEEDADETEADETEDSDEESDETDEDEDEVEEEEEKPKSKGKVVKKKKK